MPASTPKSKIPEIICQLNEMIVSGNIDDLALKRCKTEAAKLKHSDQATFFCVLGMIACIEKDDESMHANHKNSLIYSRNDPHFLEQYSVSLMNRKMYDQAYAFAKEAIEIEPLNEKALNLMIQTTNFLNNKEDEFNSYAAKWQKMKGEVHPLLAFPEDDPKELSVMLYRFDELLDSCPSLISEADEALFKLADELTQGVELD
jgi:hypothetical protein